MILSRRCNPGETAFIPPNGLECALGQNLVLLRTNEKKVNKSFLRWLVRGPEWWTQINKFINVGAIFDSLKCADIPNFTLHIPPLLEQISIGNILGTLDDKIELNKQMNKTLEQLGQAYFKHWFVDFEFSNEEGEPYKSSGGEMVDSELGEIPIGWRIGSIGDIAINFRIASSPAQVEPTTPYIGLEHMPRNSLALIDWGFANEVSSNKFLFEKGDILFGKLRPYFHKVGIAAINGICSTDIIVIKPLSQKWYGYIIFHISSDELINYVNSLSIGTKMPRTSWGDIMQYKVVIPSGEVTDKFSSIVKSFVEKITTNIYEIKILSYLRDILLPKLMSGEIRVPVPEVGK